MLNFRSTLLVAGWAMALIGASHASVAAAASFACDKAKLKVEKAICNSPEVSTLDEYLGRYYAAARATFPHAGACLVTDQRTWLRTVRNNCSDATCLKQVYLDRLAVLHAIQPGATSLRNVDLPPRPALVWIVPPASDEVAAPRNRKTKPLVAVGKLRDEVTTGDGYFLETDSREKYMVVPLMFVEEPTTDALTALAHAPDATYEVRGHAGLEPGEDKAFASSKCTFVYRMPH